MTIKTAMIGKGVVWIIWALAMLLCLCVVIWTWGELFSVTKEILRAFREMFWFFFG